MAKGFAIHNSMTSHGGIIQATQQRTSQMGNSFLRAGDGHFCPKCKCWSKIIKSHDHIIMDGQPVAYVDDLLTCGAKILPKQDHVVGDSQGSNYRSSELSSSRPLNIEQNFNNNRFVEEQKYENYYIEQNKTDYVTFKNLLFPYDDDKKSLFGIVLQGISGACEYIVTHIVQGRELFVTVSFIPPTLKNDAQIFPSASLKIYKENSRKYDLIQFQQLKKEAGYWNTENGREPVGSCKIQLPLPDLSLVKVVLEMGYEAKLDSGGIFPNPRFVTHTFTLNSAARSVK